MHARLRPAAHAPSSPRAAPAPAAAHAPAAGWLVPHRRVTSGCARVPADIRVAGPPPPSHTASVPGRLPALAPLQSPASASLSRAPTRGLVPLAGLPRPAPARASTSPAGSTSVRRRPGSPPPCRLLHARWLRHTFAPVGCRVRLLPRRRTRSRLLRRLALPHVDSAPHAAPPVLGRVAVHPLADSSKSPPCARPGPATGGRIAASASPRLRLACSARYACDPLLADSATRPRLAGYSSRRERRGRLCPAGSPLRLSAVSYT